MAARTLALLTACACCAWGATWKVRLFWLSPPTEATVRRGSQAAIRFRVSSRPTHFDGPVTLAVPGTDPVAIEFPLDVAVTAGRLRFTVTMPQEEYVAGVLAGESSVFRSAESLKAMAVTARTYALHFAGRHRAEGFDFCDTTHCQDLRLAARSARLRDAVEATEGEVLWYDGSPAATYYSRDCGGMTEAGGPRYLASHPDSWCGPFSWHAALSAAELSRVGLQPPLEVVDRTATGRVRSVRAGSKRMPIDTFLGLVGETLGWNRLRSSWFEVSPDGVFDGRGSGHGIGLCQRGAAAMGEAGHAYRDILAFYFPGTKLGINARGFPWTVLHGERVELWTTEPAADGVLVALGDRMIRRAEETVGFGGPARVRMRVYPTVAAFRDATGEPGTVAASTIGATVRMQPAAVLRERGVLESTVFHEMVHATLETRTRPDTPDWLREGLAAALSGGRVPAKVTELLRRYDRSTVLGWLEHGIPESIGR